MCWRDKKKTVNLYLFIKPTFWAFLMHLQYVLIRLLADRWYLSIFVSLTFLANCLYVSKTKICCVFFLIFATLFRQKTKFFLHKLLQIYDEIDWKSWKFRCTFIYCLLVHTVHTLHTVSQICVHVRMISSIAKRCPGSFVFKFSLCTTNWFFVEQRM